MGSNDTTMRAHVNLLVNRVLRRLEHDLIDGSPGAFHIIFHEMTINTIHLTSCDLEKCPGSGNSSAHVGCSITLFGARTACAIL
jgi:hypothetical protein